MKPKEYSTPLEHKLEKLYKISYISVTLEYIED